VPGPNIAPPRAIGRPGASAWHYVALVAHWIVGRWRIVEMDLWDQDALDLVGPAFIELRADGTGEFRFIVVEGDMDCRRADVDGRPRIEFTWEGNDEGDPRSGRGWAELAGDGSLRGHIFFHAGDDSSFRAVKNVERNDT